MRRRLLPEEHAAKGPSESEPDADAKRYGLRVDDGDEAREMYQQGVGATERKGDAHARSEMQAALELLG